MVSHELSVATRHLVSAGRAQPLLRASQAVDLAYGDWSYRIHDPDDELFDLERSVGTASRLVRAATGRLSRNDLLALLDEVCGKSSRAGANLELYRITRPKNVGVSDHELMAALRGLYREADEARRGLRRR